MRARTVSLKLKVMTLNMLLKQQFTFAFRVQQPLNEPRVEGTKHKAASMLNLIRWVSARTIKENLNPPKGYRYPFQG